MLRRWLLRKVSFLCEQLAELDEVVEVRGRGLLLASELSEEALGGGAMTAAQVAAGCLQASQSGLGVVVNAVTPTAIRWAPPYVMPDAEITQAVEIFQAVLQAGSS